MSNKSRGRRIERHRALRLLLLQFGKQADLAASLGISQTAISGWVKLGMIPNHRLPELFALTDDENLKHSLALWSRENVINKRRSIKASEA